MGEGRGGALYAFPEIHLKTTNNLDDDLASDFNLIVRHKRSERRCRRGADGWAPSDTWLLTGKQETVSQNVSQLFL